MGLVMRKVKVAILGAGTAGLTALSIVRRQTEDFVIINEGWYGTTCAKVGCMPSKVLIQIADDYDRLKKLAVQGIHGTEHISLNTKEVMQRVRTLRDKFVTNTLRPLQDLPAEKNLNGKATFIGTNQLLVSYDDGRTETIAAEKIIIATGSRPILPESWQMLAPKVVTSDQFFEIEDLPKRVAVIGLGVIGLELGQAMARLGVEVVGVEMADTIAGISDPEVKAKALELIGADFPLHLGVAAQLDSKGDVIQVTAGDQQYEVDLVLAAMGRRPNIDTLSLGEAGVELDERGMPKIEVGSFRILNPDIYLAGDVTGQKAILHEAADEGRITAYNAMATINLQEDQHYGARVDLGMAFTHPNIAFFGKRLADLNSSEIVIGSYDFNLLGRPRVMQEFAGLIRLYADKQTKRLLGGEMIAPRGEHLVHQLAWVAQLKVEIADILRLPFYHPNLEEGTRHALRELAKQLYDTPQLELMLPELP